MYNTNILFFFRIVLLYVFVVLHDVPNAKPSLRSRCFFSFFFLVKLLLLFLFWVTKDIIKVHKKKDIIKDKKHYYGINFAIMLVRRPKLTYINYKEMICLQHFYNKF